MKKIIVFIVKIFCGLVGIMFLLGTFGGLIACYSDQSHLLLYSALTLIFFLIGIGLLKLAIRKSPSNDHLDSLRNADSKPSHSSIEYIKDGSCIAHADGSPISDKEIPYLIQSGYEPAIRSEKTSNNPKFHRTEREDELAFDFMMKHTDELGSYIDQSEELYRKAHAVDDLSCRIELLKQSLIVFEKARKFAYSKGKGGIIYFQDMYEHMHNSQNDCFSYADTIQASLDSAIRERDVIIPGILQAVGNNDGILQKNIYEQLPDISKSDIQREIRKLENENVLSRTPKSNSYELRLIK